MYRDSGLSVGVQRNFREKFQKVGRAQDKPEEQVNREFMRSFIDHQDRLQSGSAMSDAELRGGGNGLA